MDREHKGRRMADLWIRAGKTGFSEEAPHIIEYRLTGNSNPSLGSVLVACARAAYSTQSGGEICGKDHVDVALVYLCADRGLPAHAVSESGRSGMSKVFWLFRCK